MKPIRFLFSVLLSCPCSIALNAQKPSVQVVDSLVEIIKEHRENFQYAQAIKEADNALKLAKQVEYLDGQGDILVQKGRINKELGYPREAIIFYDQALAIRTKLRDSSGIAGIYNNLSSAYEMMERYPEGFECSKNAIKIWTKMGDQTGNLARAYNNLANLYDDIDQIDSAMILRQKTLDLALEVKDTFMQSLAEYGLGKSWLEKENYTNARSFLSAAMEKNKYLEDSAGLALAYQSLGILDLRENRKTDALNNLQKSKNLFAAIRDTVGLGIVYQNLGLAFELNDQFEQAKMNYDSAAMFRFGATEKRLEGRKRVIGGSRLDYIETTHDLLATKAQEKRLNNIINAILVICALLATILALVLYRLLRMEQRLSELKHDVIKSSLSAINNHLLADLSGFAPGDPGYSLIFKVRGMVNRLLTRIGFPPEKNYEIQTIKPFAREMHQLAMETSLILVEDHSYLDEIEDYVLSKELRENIEAIVLESFTNINKYAACTKSSIGFFVDEEGFKLEIEDNGIGFNPETTREGGLGLKNIRNRAKKMNGRLSISSSPGAGTKIKIVIASFP